MELKKMALEIMALKNADLALRDRLAQDGKLSEGYGEDMKALHNANAATLSAIIDRIGYPTEDLVGKEAAAAAWLVIQHAIEQPEFMKKCRKLLESAVKENRAGPVSLAYLADRIAVFENRLQQYGTQFDWDENGQLSPNSMDSLDKANERRKAIGLNSIEEQTDLMRQRAKNENQVPPTDFEARKKEMEAWKKKAGWIK